MFKRCLMWLHILSYVQTYRRMICSTWWNVFSSKWCKWLRVGCAYSYLYCWQILQSADIQRKVSRRVNAKWAANYRGDWFHKIDDVLMMMILTCLSTGLLILHSNIHHLFDKQRLTFSTYIYSYTRTELFRIRRWSRIYYHYGVYFDVQAY